MWLLYVPQLLKFQNSKFCPYSAFKYFVWISVQIGIISLRITDWSLIAFEKLRKATINFVMSVFTEQLGSHWSDFHEI